jgi:hypothetical protein
MGLFDIFRRKPLTVMDALHPLIYARFVPLTMQGSRRQVDIASASLRKFAGDDKRRSIGA